jgi:flagellar secretion chaperone FliS
MDNGISTYFDFGILSADPLELVRMLYRGAIDAVENARQHLRDGKISERSAQLTKAGAIIAHLTCSVREEADPALANRLIGLYSYMQRRLMRGNIEQADGPLAEVSQLLSTLLEAWSQCGSPQPDAVAGTTPAEEPVEEPAAEDAGAGDSGATYGGATYGGAGYSDAEEDVPEYAGQSWSL